MTALFLAAGFSSIPAFAISVTESTDFPNSQSFGVSATRLGLLDTGSNTVSGALAGNCLNEPPYGIGCNPSSGGGDSQDSFIVEVGSGYQIDSLFVTTSNVSGPDAFSASFGAYTSSFATVAADYFLPLGSTTSNLVLTAIGPGEYSLSMFGQTANAEGAYSLDYTIQMNVSAIPVPAAAWLFGSGLVGLIGISRRRKAA
jgi:hypothetical protein